MVQEEAWDSKANRMAGFAGPIVRLEYYAECAWNGLCKVNYYFAVSFQAGRFVCVILASR